MLRFSADTPLRNRRCIHARTDHLFETSTKTMHRFFLMQPRSFAQIKSPYPRRRLQTPFFSLAAKSNEKITKSDRRRRRELTCLKILVVNTCVFEHRAPSDRLFSNDSIFACMCMCMHAFHGRYYYAI